MDNVQTVGAILSSTTFCANKRIVKRPLPSRGGEQAWTMRWASKVPAVPKATEAKVREFVKAHGHQMQVPLLVGQAVLELARRS